MGALKGSKKLYFNFVFKMNKRLVTLLFLLYSIECISSAVHRARRMVPAGDSGVVQMHDESDAGSLLEGAGAILSDLSAQDQAAVLNALNDPLLPPSINPGPSGVPTPPRGNSPTKSPSQPGSQGAAANTAPTRQTSGPVSDEPDTTTSLGNILYSVAGSLLAGTLMFTLLFDPIRKSFIHLIDLTFGTGTGTSQRKRREALDEGLAMHVAVAFDAFTSMQDKVEAIHGLVNS